MTVTSIAPSTLQFLRELQANNNREWFNEHKDQYLEEQASMVTFAEALMDRMSHHDELVPMSGKKILFRIYRDTRFSKDKTPYKGHISGSLKRATVWKRGGYYFHIEPGASFMGGGFWGPNSDDLKRIREELASDAAPLRKIIAADQFKKSFGTLQGDQLKTAPQGYTTDHTNIDLLRYKQFIMSHQYTDKEVTSKDFLDQLVGHFRDMRPFLDYMSEVLTTDANGVPIKP